MPELRMKAPVAMRGGRCLTLTEIPMSSLRNVAVARARAPRGFPAGPRARVRAVTYPVPDTTNPRRPVGGWPTANSGLTPARARSIAARAKRSPSGAGPRGISGAADQAGRPAPRKRAHEHRIAEFGIR